MDQKFPKMWVQGKQDLSWKDVSLINFACDSLKNKSLVFVTPGSSQTSSSEVNAYLAVPVNQAFTYQLSIDNLF